MASEQSEDVVSVSLPSELATWVDQQAADRDASRETVLVELLAAHQAAEKLNGDGEVAPADIVETADIDTAVRNVIASRLSEIADIVTSRIDLEDEIETTVAALDVGGPDASELDERIATILEQQFASELTDRLQTQIEAEIEPVESEFTAKIEDVRERVIQIKTEVDGKASADHDHPELRDRLTTVAEQTEAASDEIEDLTERLESDLHDQEVELADLEDRVSDMQEKLQLVARVVRDLREDIQVGDKRAPAVEQIKRVAAENNIDHAKCEMCGETVSVALMSDPECPHCESTVTDVEPAEGFFGSAKLVKAQGIEAGDDNEDA